MLVKVSVVAFPTIVSVAAGKDSVAVPNAPVIGESVTLPLVALLNATDPTDVPATPSVSLLVPSEIIPATTFTSAVPAPRMTELAVRLPPVLVTVPPPAGADHVPSPRKKLALDGVPVIVAMPVTEARTPPVVAGKVMVVESVPAKVRVLLTVKILLFATAKVEEVAGAVIAILFTLVAVATPSMGVTSVGVVSTTNLVPVPV